MSALLGHRTVSIAWLAAFRILFGLTMFVSMVRFIAYGWIDPFFVEPTFHFKYYGFGFIEPLPGPFIHALFWVLAALALAIAAGFFHRVAAALFFLGFSYVALLDVTIYLNHYYLASLLIALLALSPAHHAWSADVWLGRVTARAEVSVAWHWLFRVQVGVVYTFAGWAKVTEDWLVNNQPLSIWLASRTELPLLGPLLAEPWAAPFMSWAGCLFDLSIPWFLLYRRTRVIAFLVVLGFHAATRTLFPIGMFPFIMVIAATVFFPPSWASFVPLPLRAVEPAPRFVAGPIAVLYCAFQLLMPLRYLAYPGNVAWHEQGMRFSWRVMVREKNGSVTFRVTDLRGHTEEVPPRRYLNRVQEREMSSQPDLILQLAHHIRDDFEAKGRGPVQVRADALVSLNGRRAARLIDPEVDLARVEDGVLPKPWILPAPSDTPPRIRAVALR